VSKFGRGRRGGMMDYSEKAKGDQTANWPAAQQIHYYLGDFGDWLVEALQERMESDKESCDHLVSMALSQYLGK